MNRLFRIGIVIAGASAAAVAYAEEANDVRSSAAALKQLNTEPTPEAFLPADEAIAALRLPDGFHATMFASEPMVRQPIGMTTDARGRLWVAENYTYSEGEVGFHPDLRDQIVILEDSDGDGRADRRQVFWDQAQRLTSVAVGQGGVWALCPPYLYFLPDANRDDLPDGPPVVHLDGFDADQVRHNVVNGLKWGPDGWLYGRHGILRTSLPGRPETVAEQRAPLNCGIWRYHPLRQEFEIVAQGTTNPWGADWDEHGQMFFINTVIGHLWHVVPGAHYERMYGVDFNPYLYELIPQTADHFHWDTNEQWLDIRKLGVTPTTDLAGGGHAHSGLLIYQGDNWPEEYRGDVYTINFHGRCLNRDRLARHGAGYVATHADDLLYFGDPWFRGIDLLLGQDGGVFVSDWSDAGECHDEDGIHRTSGRIYKIDHESSAGSQPVNLYELSSRQLCELLEHDNVWYARHAQQVLAERAAAGSDVAAAVNDLHAMYEGADDAVHRLRAMWSLHGLGAADAPWLTQQLRSNNEHLRVWAIRLLAEQQALSSGETAAVLLELAENDPSGLVLTFLASSLQSMPPSDRWPLAERLVARTEVPEDPTFRSLLWYGIEPAVSEDPGKAVAAVQAGVIPKIRKHIVRRLAENLKANQDTLALLSDRLTRGDSPELRIDLLDGMAEALEGWRQAEAPAGWTTALQRLANGADADAAQRARELLVVFGDGRALDELRQIAADRDAPVEQRRSAIRSLVVSRAEALSPLLQQLLEDRDVAAEAIRGLAAFADPDSARLLIRYYDRFEHQARLDAINTLAARPESARSLLTAVEAGQIPQVDVPAFQVRQMWTMGDDSIRTYLQRLWPSLRHTSQQKASKIAELTQLLSREQIAAADSSAGRALFERSCASCHRLFGKGAAIGPDLTGAQRSNLNYLLQNIVDPSLQLADNYRMSIVLLVDGRTISGVVTSESENVVKIQTPTELISVPQKDIEEIVASNLSMMPERLLDVLTPRQTCDLFAYLMSPSQQPLPDQREPN